ncbi:CD99 molecule isoform X2 [Fundulus heteroclitus]|uniref:CD99 molecule isoform X2 n=1 Tax=Fundulus heteroclitus TaxID=8078 RepID=UPI00165B0B59|nr:CD99 molecule isoform X2 [Fundulus heteroclitus]
MEFCLRILSLLLLITPTLTDEGFNLEDAFGPDPTPVKPKEQPESPKLPGGNGDLNLLDAFGPAPTPKPKQPSSGGTGDDFGFDLSDALLPGATSEPKQPAVKPPSGGGGGTFDDNDLLGVSESDDYKPDKGGSGGRAMNPGSENQGGADQPQDPDLPWGQILKMLNANMPEEFFMWMSNLKQVISPLLERVEELLRALP